MKMKIIFIIGFSLYSALGLSQSLVPDTNGNNTLELPNVTPPSPEAFAFTKYSSGISEFTGKANVSIPLYTYTAGKLQLPISLSYTSSGVKVDDYPTWTGMNWLLNTGGVITRVVKNLADEVAASRLNLTDAEINYDSASDCSPGASVFSQFRVQYPFIDTEKDVFQFNFNGYSGSFYLEEINGILTPTLTKLENPIKIEVVGNNLRVLKEFLITTPDGVKYYFGGTNAVEETSSNVHETVVPTAYYLTKIVHPVNGTILLEYETATQTNIYKLGKTNYGEYPYSGGFIGGAVQIKQSFFVNKVKNQRFIKKIKSLDNNEEIIFNNTSYNPYTDDNIYIASKKVLNNIEIVNTVNSVTHLTKKIEFHYQAKNNNIAEEERFFLDKIEINKGLQGSLPGKKYEVFNLEYNAPFDLPVRMSNAQDMEGYYNGKTLNKSLLPDNEVINYLHYPGFADRFANFTFASKGVLKKIIYPTGGYTEFEYESNPGVKDVYTRSGTVAFRNAHLLDQPTSPGISQLNTTIPHQSGEIVLPDGFIEQETIDNDHGLVDPMIKTQTVDIRLSLNVLSIPSGSMINSSTDRAVFTLKNAVTNAIIAQKTIIITSSHIQTKNDIITQELAIGEKYKIEVQIPNAGTSAASLYANASVVYHSGYEQVDAAGLRVKRQKDYSKANVIADYKRYYYSPAEYVYNTTNILSVPNVISPSFDLVIRTATIPQDGGGGEASSSVFIVMYSNLTNQNILSAGATNGEKAFKYITTSYGGDDFENGGIQKNYNVTENEPIKRKIPVHGDFPDFINEFLTENPDFYEHSSLIWAIKRLASYENDNRFTVSGNCIKERILKKEDNSLKIIKDVDYVYNNTEVKNINNLIIKDATHESIALYCNGQPVAPISTMYIGVYKTFTFNNFLLSSTTNEYFEPVTVINKTLFDELDLDYDFSNVKKMTTTQTYNYGSLIGLPIKTTTLTSGGVSRTTENTYANQASTLIGPTGAQLSAYAKLEEINNIATPIQVSQFENSTTLLSKQRTLYKQSLANANIVLPEVIQTAKGSQTLEDRVVFEEYDAKGNPTLFSYKYGTKVKYLYNENNQVYLKIENFTGTLDPNTNPLSSEPCTFMSSYPNAMVTIYTYDPVTNLLVQTMDSNCRKTTYEYDVFHRLKQIKDHDGNVIKEFENNYRPQ